MSRYQASSFAFEAFLSHIRQEIEGLPSDWVPDPTDPVASDNLSHADLQGIIVGLQRVNPQLHRLAILEANWCDVEHWLAESDAASVEGRPGRNDYRTASVQLMPVMEEHLPALYHGSMYPQTAHQWRFRGLTPGPDEFRAAVFSPVISTQFVVAHAETGEIIGLVMSYDADTVAGHAYLGMHRVSPDERAPATKGLMIEGFLVFVEFLFDHFDYRKLYVEVPEYNLGFFASETLLVQEGVQRDHHYFSGRRWSKTTFAIWRDDWEALAGPYRGT